MRCNLILAISGAILSAGTAPARANPFTFAPNAAAPVLGGSTFTADTLYDKNYNRTTNFNDFTTLRQTVNGNQYALITGFSLNGAPVTPAGFDTNYGLYIHITSTFSFPINAAGVTIGPSTYTALNFSLVADVGHDDGTLATSAAAIGFSNAAGVANDVILATGSLVSATNTADPDGTRHGFQTTTFVPSAGETGFFVDPSTPSFFVASGTSAPNAFSVVSVSGPNFVTLVDGSLSTASGTLVPEPSSAGLLGVGALGLHFLQRRRLKPRGSPA